METKVYSEEITKVHKGFSEASDRLYDEAIAIINAGGTTNEDKARKLLSLGFTATKEAVEMQQRLKERNTNKDILKLITYYRKKYPLNKFITEEDIKILCGKYGLIYGYISSYKGFVPQSRISVIESFRTRRNDRSYRLGSRRDSSGKIEWDGGQAKRDYSSIYSLVKEYELMIAAPERDFVYQRNQKIIEYRITNILPDPVVLAPVKDGFLIVTAWGDEASDPIVKNEIEN